MGIGCPFYYRFAARCRQRPSIRDANLDQVISDAVVRTILHPDLIAAQVERHEQEKRQQKTSTQNERDEVETAVGQRLIDHRPSYNAALKAGVLSLDKRDQPL
jgi:hypothetical protein